jgi:hypothetical protein
VSAGVVVPAETIAAVATAASIGLTAIVWLGRRVWKMVKRGSQFLDDYEGTPARPGVAARPGVMQRLHNQDVALASIGTKVEAIQAEMPKNGVPLAHKIDALWNRHLADLANPPGTTVIVHTNEGGNVT